MPAKDDLNPRKRGLGRGLDALFESDEDYDFPVGDEGDPSAAMYRKTVGIEQLDPNPAQPRQSFSDEALDELAASIKEYGLLQPLLVRPKKDMPDIYEIIAGERRWRAAQRARVHEIPIVIRELDDSQALQIGLVENLQRQDLNPMEEAQGYQNLMDKFGHTQLKVSELVGKSRSYVTNMLRLTALPPLLQDMLRAGDLSNGHARALLMAQDPVTLAQRVVAEGLSVRALEAIVAKEKRGGISPKKAPVAPVEKDMDTIALERELSEKLGMHVTIDLQKDKKSGSFQIAFSSLDQLDYLIERLS